MVDSKAFDDRLVRIQVVRDHRLDPEIAREIAAPLHESVRIALDEYVQPQNLPGFSVHDYADRPSREHGLVRADDSRLSALLLCLFSARVSSSLLDIAPRARAPRIRRICPPRSIPC